MSDHELRDKRNASTVDMVDAPILPDDLRIHKRGNRDSMPQIRPYRDKSTNTSTTLPPAEDDNHQRVSPLRHLTQEPDLSKLTRKHNIAMNGHVGHGRNLTQSINFLSSGQYQPDTFALGWGLDKEELKQGPELQRVRALPVEQQTHKKYWDHEVGEYNLKTSGWFAAHVDEQLGIRFEDLEGLSVR